MSGSAFLPQHEVVTSVELYLFEKTRDKRVLFWTVVIILAMGVLLAAFFGLVEGHAKGDSYSLEEQSKEETAASALRDWKDLLQQPDLEFADFLEAMPPLIFDLDDSGLDQASDDLQKMSRSDEEKEIADLVFQSLLTEKMEPVPELVELAKKAPPVRYAQQALGIVLYGGGEEFLAARAYEKEGLFPDADIARDRTVTIYDKQNRFSDLERLSKQVPYVTVINAGVRLRMAAKRQDWGTFWHYLLPAQYSGVPPEIFLMAFLSGIIWLTIFCRLLQLESLRSSSFLLCLAAFCLGIVSTWPTVFTYSWLEEVWGFTENNQPLNDVVYYIFGVGVIEESMKLLLFCPLIPILIRRDNQLEILLVAGCVGLGFGAEENIGYFDTGEADVLAARFVTANFLHISATALSGLALCRAISDPAGYAGVFLKWFGGIILIHGLYDIFQGTIPGLGDTQIPAMACYIFLCYKFFGQAHELRVRHRQIIALNFIFLTGLALLVALAMIDLSAAYGFQHGMSMTVVELAGTCVVAYLFVREFSRD